MESLRVQLDQAYAEEDYSRVIQLIDRMSTIKNSVMNKQIYNSLMKSSLTERKENTYEYLPYMFITVNPKPDCTLVQFQQLIHKMLLKKWLKSYVYVLEQRSTNEEEIGKGFHMHIIIKKPDGKSVAHMIREIASTFKKVCDISNYHCYNTKQISEEEYKRKLVYILGRKQDVDKEAKQDIDRLWRQRMNIKSFYFSNIDIGEYAPKDQKTQ